MALERAEGDTLLILLLTIALQTFMVLLLLDCRDFGIANVPGPSLGMPLVFHQRQDTTEDMLRKAVAAAEKVFGWGKPTIIFVCLPQAGECSELASWKAQACTAGVVAGPALSTGGLEKAYAWVTGHLGTLPWERH